MSKEDILKHLDIAQRHIERAARMVENEFPTPPVDYVTVLPGDNLMQMIQDSPENSKFLIHNDFVQNCGPEAVFAKPCTLTSQYARLVGQFYPKPLTHFIGMTLEGGSDGTILTGANSVTLDGCTLQGNPSGQHRGIMANCRGMRVRNTRILGIIKDQDTQAICGTNGTSDLQVLNCELEASGENILFGGDTSDSEANIPNNILIEGCILSKKVNWPSWATCKFLLELKQAINVTIRGNIMEYSFADGNIGYAIAMTVRNEYGQSPWAIVKNVTLQGNTIRHMAGGVQILGRDDRGDSYPSQVMTNVMLIENKFEDISNQWGWNGRQVFISGGPNAVMLDGNTFQCATTPNSALNFDQPQYKVEELVVRNNEFIEGDYGIFGTSAPGIGKAAIDYYAPGYVWENNKVHKSGINNITWPDGTVFV